jgi:hypothetical protein
VVKFRIPEVRGYQVEEKSAGIYTVSGDIVPIQIIESKRLSGGERRSSRRYWRWK